MPGAGGDVAVETFIIVSGFYMALILTRTYRSPWRFLANRALRIYPTYFVCARLAIVVAGGARWPR